MLLDLLLDFRFTDSLSTGHNFLFIIRQLLKVQMDFSYLSFQYVASRDTDSFNVANQQSFTNFSKITVFCVVSFIAGISVLAS